jgi:hypothetical protein
VNIKGQYLVLCLVLAGAVVEVRAQTAARSVAAGQVMPAAAEQLLAMANEARAEAGAGPLKWDGALAIAARQHCLRMAAEGPISHRYAGEPDLAERAGEAGARFSLIEENVALAPTPGEIQDAWMHSPGHRANLLNPSVDRVGLAVVASRGELYAVADYASGVARLTQAQAEAQVAELIRPSGVTIVANPAQARAACAVDQGMPTSQGGAQATYVMRWQAADLNRLPPALVGRLATGHYRQAAVGSCALQGTQGESSGFRVAVLLY